MIFDIKMDFTRKARLVASGHTTKTPASTTYSSVVLRISVRIAFMFAAPNDLDILAADVGNAYLNANCREKIWTIAGPEVGLKAGTAMIIEEALYGLKTSGAAWRALLASLLTELGYESTKVDPNVWIRPAVKPNRFEYYEMLLVYVDDILVVAFDPKLTMDAIGKLYRLKEGSVGSAERSLGANIKRVQLPNGTMAWSIGADEYIDNALETVKATLESEGMKLKGKAPKPLPNGYRPEMDVSPECNAVITKRYQEYIRILRWALELGQVDVVLEVSLMSLFNALPREGHLEALYHMFAYLAKAD
jgi:hypothetical protein